MEKKEEAKTLIEELESHKTFEDRYNFDVKKYKMVEKKNNLDYISWAWAQRLGRTTDSEFNWIPIKNEENGTLNHSGMVLIEMTYKKETLRHNFPILNYANKPILNPNAFDINTAQMRGMTKLFSMMSGYGLSLYTGEDLKLMDEAGKEELKQGVKLATTQQVTKIKELVDDIPALCNYYKITYLEELPYDKAEEVINRKTGDY